MFLLRRTSPSTNLLLSRCARAPLHQQPQTAPSTVALIKALRHTIPGVSLALAKQALLENAHDLDAATAWIQKQMRGIKPRGQLKEGWVGVARTGDGGACMMEVNSETDFVARTPLFTQLVQDLLHTPDIDRTAELLDRASAQLCEPLAVARRTHAPAPVGLYVHSSEPAFRARGLGRIGALVALSRASPHADRVAQLVVAYQPTSVDALLQCPTRFDAGTQGETVADLLRDVQVLSFERYEVGRGE